MILGFKQSFPWKEPTMFREKILLSVDAAIAVDGNGIAEKNGEFIVSASTKHGYLNPKLHTIREDKHNRWKPGMSIQMVYRGPKYSIADHFNKGIKGLEKCVSVQDFQIRYSPYAFDSQYCAIEIGDLPLTCWMGYVMPNGSNSCAYEDRKFIERLAHNDGFSDSKSFFRWFKKDFTGKLIHWTNLQY